MAVPRPPQIFRQLQGSDTDSWWKVLPCPHSRSWGLHDISERDLQKLKRKVAYGGNITKHMVIEACIYLAFLECPVGLFYNQGVTKALRHLQNAEDCTNDPSLCNTIEGRTGYGIIINTFRMRIRPLTEYESKLKQLLTGRDSHPDTEAFINATHAYFLSKLGPRRVDDSIRLYTLARKSFPHNCEWMYGMAWVIGKKTRELRLMLDIDRPLPDFIRKKFREERDLLDRVLNARPDFYHVRALYGQALYNISWKDRAARGHIDEALNRDPSNPDILSIFARYYRRKGLLEEGLATLKRHEDSEVAEIHCQLGYLYRKMSFKAKVRHESCLEYQELSLKHFNRAIELDNRHYPSISSAIEMTVLLGMTEIAAGMLQEMLEMFWKSSHSTSAEFIAIKQGIEKKFFGLAIDTKHLITLSHRCVELASYILKKNDKEIPCWTIPTYTLNMIKTPLKYLGGMTTEGCLDHQLMAKMKLAHVYVLIGRYDDAERLYIELNDDHGINVPEIVWGLSKVYFLKGCQEDGASNFLGANFLWQKALHKAKELSLLRVDDRYVQTKLEADVYLAKAKFLIRTQPEDCMDATDQWNQCNTAEFLKMAIARNSLESCYIYLNHTESLIESYFFSPGVTQTLAQIKAVCCSGVSLHTDFPIIDTRAIIIGDEIAIKDFILAKVEKKTEYASALRQGDNFSTVLEMLDELRKKRLVFEGELLKLEGRWHASLKDSTISVLRVARELLDESIASCQETLMESPPDDSMFFVAFDFKYGKPNKEQAEKETRKALTGKTFKGFKENELPTRIYERIIEMQPKYDEKNLWLAGLHSFNNMHKHHRKKLQFEETFELTLKKKVPDPSRWHFRTRDLVQQSCKEVESFALFCISYCESRGITGQSTPGQEVFAGQ